MSEKKQPDMRFKGFHEDWNLKALNDIASMKARIGWQGLTQKEFLDDGDYYLITGTDFANGKIDFKNCHFIDRVRYEQDVNIQIKNGDVLITKDGTIGKVAYVTNMNKPTTLNAGVFVIRGKTTNTSNLYLYHYLAAPFLLKYANQQATGGTIKHLNQNVLVDFPIPIPGFEEQIKIGELFKELDNLIALNQSKYDKLISMKKACLEKMFPKDGADSPEIRFKGFSGKWKQCKIKEVCSISTGKSNTQDRIEDGKYPFYVRSPIVERSNRYLFDEEAVLTVGDGVGTGKVFHYVHGKYDLHQRVYRMFDFNIDMLPKYFYFYFSVNFYNRVMSMTAKTSVDSVRLEMISEMDIVYPEKEEQKNIVEYLEGIDKLIDLSKTELENLKNIKKALLEKMFI